MLLTGHSWLAGCASLPLADGGGTAAAVCDEVAAKHLSPERYRVRPRRLWDATGIARRPGAAVPPVLRGYLRLGARGSADRRPTIPTSVWRTCSCCSAWSR